MAPVSRDERDRSIMQQCLARALRRASRRQRARLESMRPEIVATWRRAHSREWERAAAAAVSRSKQSGQIPCVARSRSRDGRSA